MGQDRGQPLFVLVALLAGWIGGRFVSWQTDAPPPFPFEVVEAAESPATEPPAEQGYLFDPRIGPLSQALGAGFAGAADRSLFQDQDARPAGMRGWAVAFAPGTGCQVCVRHEGAAAQRSADPGYRDTEGSTIGGVLDPRGFAWGASAQDFIAAGRHGAAQGEGSGGGNGERNGGARRDEPDQPGRMAGAHSAGVSSGVASGVPSRPNPTRRWTADAWALLRRGEHAILPPGLTAASYGASQAGAVLRYRIVRGSAYRPTAYMRTTSTLGQLQESAAAAGLSARPVPSIPVYAAAEMRLTQQAGLNRWQPAAMIVTELPPIELPAGFRGEFYGQAGYVGGQYATAFGEGMVRIDHPLLSVGRFRSSAGGGFWSGAQKGVSRMDLGPSVSLAFPLRQNMFGRLSLDWRMRVAGNAEPGNGPALTLSAGF